MIIQYLTKASNLGEDAACWVDAVRRFNRFYTRRVGALRAGLLGSPYSLPEARVLYELGQRGECTASELAGPGSRPGLPQPPAAGPEAPRPGAGEAATEDARRSRLTLTTKGRKAFTQLDARSRDEVGAMLAKLGREQARLVGAMQTVEVAAGTRSRRADRCRCAPTAPATWAG